RWHTRTSVVYLCVSVSYMVHVTDSDPESPTDNLVNGDLQGMFQVVSGVLTYVRDDKVRALAVMAAERSPALPDVPSMVEAGYPALQASRWYALLAPRGTPPDILQHYNEALNEVLASPALHDRLLELGATPLGGTPEDLDNHLKDETQKWGAVIEDAHLQPR